jgi:RNA polymerase sigma-54 factor
MRNHLYASPVSIFELEQGGSVRTEYVEPDVILTLDDEGNIVVDLRDDGYPKLRINHRYYRAFRQSEKDEGRKFSEEEKQSLRNYMNRAKLYIENIYSRMDTMRSIVEYLVEHQREFILSSDPKDIKPLTRSELAAEIGRDPSTVGRALGHKYVQFPSKEIVSFAKFFQSNLSVKEVLKDIVASENGRKPYSDKKLAELLAEKGYPVARRTIAKYRVEAGIPPAHRRKLH